MLNVSNRDMKKIVVDLKYLRKMYINLRGNLLVEALSAEPSDTGVIDETLLQNLDLNLTSIMINIIANCNIVDLPDMTLDLSEPKTVHHLLINNTNMINNIEKDQLLEEKLKQEFAKFDILCIRKGELLRQLEASNTSLVAEGSKISENCLEAIDNLIKDCMSNDTQPDTKREDEPISAKINELLAALTESVTVITKLETEGALRKLEDKFAALEAKIAHLQTKQEVHTIE
ncbi:hypothetical protein QEN19_000325 [Hanseniaspora menglaensis]